MANSFCISVKPEIAAAVVKIDANKTVIDENKVILVDVHDTDLPAAVTAIGNNLTAIGANNTILADIHDTDLPGAVTKIDLINSPEHSIIGNGNLAAIPQTTWTTLLSISGRGRFFFFNSYISAGQINIRITIDSVICDYNNNGSLLGWCSETTNAAYQTSFNQTASDRAHGTHPPAFTLVAKVNPPAFSLKFNQTVLIEGYTSNNLVQCNFQYGYCLI